MLNRTVLYNLSLILIMLGFTTCIDPYILPTPDTEYILAVDGLITTQPGPHRVRLTWSNQYTNTTDGNRITIKGSKVSITDDAGMEIRLEEEIFDWIWACDNLRFWHDRSRYRQFGTKINTGFYLTPSDFKAKVGRTYTLNITTPNGQGYQSKPVKVRPVAPIDTAYFMPYSVGTTNPLINSSGLDVMVKFKDNPETKDFYLWKATNGYIELKTEVQDCCPICYIPDLQDPMFLGSTSDLSFNGLNAIQKAYSIPDNGLRFKSRYRITLDQYSIDEEAYFFFKLIKQQLSIQGSVFDPLPANIRGNVINLDHPEKQALGYFVVADVSSKTIYINKEDIPFGYRALPQLIYGSCVDYCGGLREPPSLSPPSDWVYN